MTAVSNPTVFQLSPHLSLFGGRCVLPFEEIVLIEGRGNYTLFYCRDGTQMLTSKSLSFYMPLFPADFLRVHKSYVVNARFIQSNDRRLIYLIDGRCIPVSRRRQREVRQTIHVQSNF